MIRYENDCVGICPQGCINCGRKHLAHFYCDECKGEFAPEELYDFDGDMLCTECLLLKFDTVAQNPDKWQEED